MSIRRWYSIMLFLPLLVPALLLLLNQFYSYEEMMQGLGTTARLILISCLIAGIPYLGFAAGVFFWLRKKSIDRIKKLSWFLPWILTPLCGLFCLVSFSVMYPGGDAMMVALIFMVLCVPAGFLYVAIVHVLTRLGYRAQP